ncbi:MAG: hypothetical protein M1142_05790 [Patescibacteria group bacterium]|nr:hypothetical protein [Patescibacteria group bacterium]
MIKRYIVFTLIAILNLPFLLINFLAKNYLNANVIFLLILVYVLYLIKRVENSRQGNVALSGNEKIQVIVTEALNPAIAGAFYYYCWKNQFQKKASQANKYSFIIIGVELIFMIALIQLL